MNNVVASSLPGTGSDEAILCLPEEEIASVVALQRHSLATT